MRLLAALAFALCLAPLAGCGDDTTSADLTIVHDMSANGQTCLQVVTCAQSCSGATQVSCEMACAAKGTTKAQTAFNALITCAYTACLMPGDGGSAAACSSSTDTSSGCTACVTAAAQSSACSTQLNACLSG
jgi:hypothetical protein